MTNKLAKLLAHGRKSNAWRDGILGIFQSAKSERVIRFIEDELNPVRDHTSENVESALMHGNAEELLKELPPCSVHLTVTSPPYYNARDYVAYSSYNEYLDKMESVFREVERVLVPGRFLIVNSSPVLEPRIDRNSSSVRYAVPFDLHSRIVRNGFDFIDDIVWKKPDGAVPNRNGGFFRSRKPMAYKPNAVTEYIMVYRKKTNRLIDYDIRQYSDEIVSASLVVGDYEKTNVWSMHPSSSKHHPAIFPDKLAENCIRYYSYVGDIILDPFAGSGTTAVVAKKLGRKYIACESDSTYFELIKSRF